MMSECFCFEAAFIFALTMHDHFSYEKGGIKWKGDGGIRHYTNCPPVLSTVTSLSPCGLGFVCPV